MDKKNSDEIFEKVAKKIKRNKRLLIFSTVSLILTIVFLLGYIAYLPIYNDISNVEYTEKIEMDSDRYDGSHKIIEYSFDEKMYGYKSIYYDNNGEEIKDRSNVVDEDISYIRVSPYKRIIDKLTNDNEINNINDYKIMLMLPLDIETEVFKENFSIFSINYLIQFIFFVGFIIFLSIFLITFIIFRKNKKIIKKVDRRNN